MKVDPNTLWKTAYMHIPQTAEDFAIAAGKMVGCNDGMAGVTTGGDTQFTPAGESWSTFFRFVTDIVGTTSVNLDETAVALSKILEAYVEADDEDAGKLDQFLEKNHPGHKPGDEPSRVSDATYTEDGDDKEVTPYGEHDQASELDEIAKDEEEEKKDG